MPRNTREWAHRKLDSANNNLDWVLKHCQDVIEKCNNKYPQISEPLELVQVNILEIQELLKRLGKSF